MYNFVESSCDPSINSAGVPSARLPSDCSSLNHVRRQVRTTIDAQSYRKMTSSPTNMVPFFHCKHSQVILESVTNPAIPACSPGGKVCADKDGLLAVAVVAGKLCDGQAPTVQRHIAYSAAQHYLGALYTSLHAECNASEFTERGSACACCACGSHPLPPLRLPPCHMLGSFHEISFVGGTIAVRRRLRRRLQDILKIDALWKLREGRPA